MKKQIIAALLLAACIGSLAPHAAAEETASPVEIQAKAGLLMELETGTILYEENAHEQLEPASVTKVMTMLLVTEAIDSGTLSLDDMVTTSAYAASMGGSQVFLEEGEQMTVNDMLKAVAVASGNDAAVALAEHLKGSETAFVDAMNQRAQELGMADTHFCNCTGLPAEGHVTSAYDIALMSRELLSHDLIRNYTGIWMDTLRNGAFQLANTNKLIYYYDGATGLKTGSTQAAGFCISASMLNYGFGGWAMTDIQPEENIPAVPVTLGEQDTVQPVLEGTSRMLLSKDQAGLVTTQISVAESVQAPVQKGDVLGTLQVYVGEELVQELPLKAETAVPRRTFGSIFREMLYDMVLC